MSGTCLFALTNEWLQPGNFHPNLHHEWLVPAQAAAVRGLVPLDFLCGILLVIRILLVSKHISRMKDR